MSNDIVAVGVGIGYQMTVLIDAHAELEARQMMVVADDAAYFEPTDDHPLMTVTVDARTGVFDYPRAVYLAEEIGKDGRKVGMKLVIIVPNMQRKYPDIGNSGSLLSNATFVEGYEVNSN